MIPAEFHGAIMRALRHRHREDMADSEVFVPSTTGRGVGTRRMDFLAIACAWSRPIVTGYEVKVSRRDFVGDTKFQSYLPACNSLYFVTAPGVVTDPTEIPPDCGWQEISANGAVLKIKKKAPWRAMEVTAEAVLYKHLLMRHMRKGPTAPEQWDLWLRQSRADRKLGKLVSKEVRQTVKDRVDKVAEENRQLLHRCERLENVREMLVKLGVDPTTVERGSTWGLDATIRKAVAAQQAEPLVAALESMDTMVEELGGKLEDFRRRTKGLRARVDNQSRPAEAAQPAIQ